MKYAIIIPDGAADDSLPQLGGRTPFQAANTPNMDEVARLGRSGVVRTIPEGFESGSDVATMSLLGYDPALYHTGRAPLEAAALRIPLAPTDWVFRCNLITIIDGVMKDHSAGGISNADAQSLLSSLSNDLQLDGFEFHAGVSYRNLLVYRGDQSFDVKTKPPHEIPGERIERYLPSGEGSEVLRRMIERSADVFANHLVTRQRAAAGANPATQVWLWGQGHAPAMPTFVERFGVAPACMITGVDLLRGLALLMNWDVHEVEGMTSFHDTDYARQGVESAAILDRYNLVLSHIEAPDEASHQADVVTKIAAIEAIDRHVVGPVLAKLRTFPAWRILVLPDHPTNIATRKHGYAWPPFCMAGSDVRRDGGVVFNESAAASSGLSVPQGHDLMGMFLGK